MKRSAWIIVVVLAVFLACDWTDQPITGVEVEVDGTVTQGTMTQAGSNMLLMDISNLPKGTHIFRARFIGMGGWLSDWSDPFEAAKPGKPGALKISR